MGRISEKGKRKRRASNHEEEEDRISHLPQDILISIISRLTLKEAIATSILSKTYRNLYTYTTRLDFPQFTPQYTTIKEANDIVTTTLPKYINTIDRVLESHKGSKVKQFRVHTFSLEGANVGKWLEFVLAKEVEKIDIHYAHCFYYSLERTNLVSGQQPLECLKELSLHGILLDDGELQLLLCKFPLLEVLKLVHVEPLRKVSIVGRRSSYCKLKHLEISNGNEVELIHIEGLMNLVSLKCHALPIEYSLVLNNVPNLIEFTTFDRASTAFDIFPTSSTVADILPRFPPSVRDQLRTLKVRWDFKCSRVYRETRMQLIGIKTLEIEFWLRDEDGVTSLHDLFYLIQACPSLEKLEVKVGWIWSRKTKMKANEEYFHVHRVSKKLFKWRKLPNLKKVKLSRFVGSPLELELAFSIMDMDITTTVEELVVEASRENQKIRKMAIDRARRHFRPTMLPYPFTLLII